MVGDVCDGAFGKRGRGDAWINERWRRTNGDVDICAVIFTQLGIDHPVSDAIRTISPNPYTHYLAPSSHHAVIFYSTLGINHAPSVSILSLALCSFHSQQTPQIILLKEGTDTSQGKGQLLSNINACMAVVDVVRTTLGPRGMDKLIVDEKGELEEKRGVFFFCFVLFLVRDKLYNTGDFFFFPLIVRRETWLILIARNQ